MRNSRPKWWRRLSLVRLVVAVLIVGTAALAFTLPGGIFRLAFRSVLAVGAVVLLGSYLVEWWLRRRRAARGAGDR